MNKALLDQLPKLSQFDPGAKGEGSLDPIGLSAIADRIADHLVPGIRARMSQPRFVTLSAVGAQACMGLANVTSTDGSTTFDIAFEWLVVESLVAHPPESGLTALPGIQKAQRAKATGERLSTATYLAGPRVFGFTGVYRPFAMDSAVLDTTGLPGENADRLISAWETDQRLKGFLDNERGTHGSKLRRDIEKVVRTSLEKGHGTVPVTGQLAQAVSKNLAPSGAGTRELQELHRLITSEQHPIRHELTQIMRPLLQANTALTQRELAEFLLERATGPNTRIALTAAIKYEDCATALEYAFRRLLQHGVAHLGGAFSVAQGAAAPSIAELAPRVSDLVSDAVNAANELDPMLAFDLESNLRVFAQPFTASQLVDALIHRHEVVQDAKGKRMWLDPINQDWFIRPAYRREWGQLDDEHWTHPMRMETLLNFLVATV